MIKTPSIPVTRVLLLCYLNHLIFYWSATIFVPCFAFLVSRTQRYPILSLSLLIIDPSVLHLFFLLGAFFSRRYTLALIQHGVYYFSRMRMDGQARPVFHHVCIVNFDLYSVWRFSFFSICLPSISRSQRERSGVWIDHGISFAEREK